MVDSSAEVENMTCRQCITLPLRMCKGITQYRLLLPRRRELCSGTYWRSFGFVLCCCMLVLVVVAVAFANEIRVAKVASAATCYPKNPQLISADGCRVAAVRTDTQFYTRFGHAGQVQLITGTLYSIERFVCPSSDPTCTPGGPACYTPYFDGPWTFMPVHSVNETFDCCGYGPDDPNPNDQAWCRYDGPGSWDLDALANDRDHPPESRMSPVLSYCPMCSAAMNGIIILPMMACCFLPPLRMSLLMRKRDLRFDRLAVSWPGTSASGAAGNTGGGVMNIDGGVSDDDSDEDLFAPPPSSNHNIDQAYRYARII